MARLSPGPSPRAWIRVQSGPGWAACVAARELLMDVPGSRNPHSEAFGPARTLRRFALLYGVRST